MAGQAPSGSENVFRKTFEALEGFLAQGAASAAFEAGLLDRVLAPRAVVLAEVAFNSVLGHAGLTLCGLSANLAFFWALEAKFSNFKMS